MYHKQYQACEGGKRRRAFQWLGDRHGVGTFADRSLLIRLLETPQWLLAAKIEIINITVNSTSYEQTDRDALFT